jgi:proline iminopeptidase
MSSPAQQLFGDEHVRRYRETDGEVGYIWKEGSTILLLTTTGRSTGRETTTPLIYNLDGDTPVIVASKGGARDHPGWFKNLAKTLRSASRSRARSSAPRARVAEGEERERLWELMNEVWPHYDEYATRTDREIPVVVLDRM